tara:strand:+ start:11416 stop:12453 length:1038 start_codon:yes stop_codon:yes gene_type:complete
MKKIIASIILLSFFSLATVAQTCRDKLGDAQIAFYNGQFKRVIEFMKPCVELLEIEKEKVEALELLSKSYLMLEQDSLAVKMVAQILKIQNDYKASPSRSVSIAKLVNEFKLEPKWQFGFYGGPVFMDYQLIKNRSFAGQYEIEKSFEKNNAALLGVQASYNLYKGLNVALKLEYLFFSFSNSQLQSGYRRLQSNERFQYLQMPIVLAYQYNFKRLKPFVEVGFVPQRLLSAKADITLNPVEPENLVAFSGYPQSLSNYDLRFQTEPWRNSYHLGCGLRYSINNLGLELAGSYQFSNSNIINTERIYEQASLQKELAYLPQDFSTSLWRVSLGFIYTIKEVKKKK